MDGKTVKMGVSLLEYCYFDFRDSILLTVNMNGLDNGDHDSVLKMEVLKMDDFGPSSATRAINTRREVEHATQLGRDLLDVNVATPSSWSSEATKKKMSGSTDVGCNPPKKTRNVAKMFDSRLNKEKVLEKAMKIHRIVMVSDLKQEFDVLNTNTSRVTYKVFICNVPLCSCPDFDLKRGL